MRFIIKKLNNKDYVNWLNSQSISNPIHITFTLKQSFNCFNEYGVKVKTYINQHLSSQNFKHFTNLLNYKIYRNGFLRYGKRLKMIVINELSLNNRFHHHTIIEKPQHISNTNFEELVLDKWGETNFGYKEVNFQYPNNRYEREGWVNYMLKHNNHSNTDFNTIDLVNTNF
jgi:hypothetical protein